MLLDGIKMTDTSSSVNLVIEHGPTFPDTATSKLGELFYKDNAGLYVYTGTVWAPLNDTVKSVAGKTGDVSLTTSDITEGINQYFTAARARASLTGSGNVTYDPNTGVISAPTPVQSFDTKSYFPGTIAPTVGTARWYSGTSRTLTNVFLSVSTSPTQDITIDIKKSGVSIFGSGAKPTISAGQFKSAFIPISVQMTSDDYLTIDILTGDGSDLFVRIQYQ